MRNKKVGAQGGIDGRGLYVQILLQTVVLQDQVGLKQFLLQSRRLYQRKKPENLC